MGEEHDGWPSPRSTEPGKASNAFGLDTPRLAVNGDERPVRWGFTFLMGSSRLDEEQKLKLVAQATWLYLAGKDRLEIVEDGYEGVITTRREWKVVGSFSGQQFDAVLDTDLDSGRIHLRFLVNEQTLNAGTAYSPN